MKNIVLIGDPKGTYADSLKGIKDALSNLRPTETLISLGDNGFKKTMQNFKK